MTRDEIAVTLVVALIGAGLLNFTRDTARWAAARIRAQQPAERLRVMVDEEIHRDERTLLGALKAYDEVQEDNTRLRAELAEERAGRREDRAEAETRENQLREQIDRLEQRLRDLLDEVLALKQLHRAGGENA